MENVMNIEELEKCTEKIKMYKKEEDLNMSSIKEKLQEIKYNYSSKNIETLSSIGMELIEKCKAINRIHQNNIMVLEKNIEIYKSNVVQVKNIFQDLQE